ncbi:hypothetical protein [Haliangium ochraceum]|uniref:Uncharacterized protein n=1 Tax=Haliangium ochraceum (strain DSM 14365 / JCM 11303 / SMP-2) TaxID=502025 RepID=D0LSM4_HALO1|nr:hypothetical protein [Haliangium ochraceum]ACY17246.1 hypothetical protein Hoch_4756 [Haliangium ochraceum DSM 14365]
MSRQLSARGPVRVELARSRFVKTSGAARELWAQVRIDNGAYERADVQVFDDADA